MDVIVVTVKSAIYSLTTSFELGKRKKVFFFFYIYIIVLISKYILINK